MTELSQINRQIFSTIMAFTALILFFAVVYNTGTGTPATTSFAENPPTQEDVDYFAYLNDLNVLDKDWTSRQADLYASCQESIQIFAAVLGLGKTAYQAELAAAGFDLHDPERPINRGDLYFLLAREFAA